jgi:hypothetical protein
MGSTTVDQIAPDGTLVRDVDTTISQRFRHDLLLAALPGATLERFSGVTVVLYEDQLILSKQVTYLGNPWESYKKRIQIPGDWIAVHAHARYAGLTPRFIGVYHYDGTTIFVDFDPRTYVARGLNNSSAHVATNDLFQAQTLGQFSREDKNGNRVTSIRADQFQTYMRSGYDEKNPHIDALDRFSNEFLDGARIDALTAVQEMHAAKWPDKFQNEWQGFYLEYRLNGFIQRHGLDRLIVVQKEKRKSEYDYDLRLLRNGATEHFGDLKASDIGVHDSPGNDAAKFHECLDEYGRFWYVIYEHETWKGRHSGNLSTIAWNDWRRSVGHVGRNKDAYDPLSYATKFKEAVRFVRVRVLEVNQANAAIVLGDFQKGFSQYLGQGNPRKPKVMISLLRHRTTEAFEHLIRRQRRRRHGVDDSPSSGRALEYVLVSGNVLPEDVPDGTDIHAVAHLLVTSSRTLTAEVEPVREALQPRRLPRREAPLARPDDARLRDCHEGRKIRGSLGADPRRTEVHDGVPQPGRVLGLPLQLAARRRERVGVDLPSLGPLVDPLLVLRVERVVLGEVARLPLRKVRVGFHEVAVVRDPPERAPYRPHLSPGVGPDREPGRPPTKDAQGPSGRSRRCCGSHPGGPQGATPPSAPNRRYVRPEEPRGAPGGPRPGRSDCAWP